MNENSIGFSTGIVIQVAVRIGNDDRRVRLDFSVVLVRVKTVGGGEVYRCFITKRSTKQIAIVSLVRVYYYVGVSADNVGFFITAMVAVAAMTV